MSRANDRIIVIGGGLNGLTAATSLASAGRDVLVLEARDRFGGLAARHPFGDGYAVPGILHDTSMVRAHVVEGLKLASFGLQRDPWPAPVFAADAKGAGVWIRGGTLEGDQVAPRDAERFLALQRFFDKVRPVVERLMDNPPLSIGGSLWELLKTGWALRRLGPDTMIEVLRVAPMCVADWMRDTFESEVVSASLALRAVEGQFTGPWSAHTAAQLLLKSCLATQPIRGGGAALTDALVKAAAAAGVTLQADARVVRIDTGDDGVTGVTLEDGQTIEAANIVSTLDPKHTFLRLVGQLALPVRLWEDVQRYRMRGSAAKVHVALSAPLTNLAGEAVEAMTIATSLNDVERAFDAVKYRRIADNPALDVRVPSVSTEGLCPDGHAVLSIIAHGVPYDLEGGWTDAARDRVGDRVIAALAGACPTLTDHLVDVEVLTPADIERQLGITGGHLHHGEHAPDQLMFMRPTHETGQYDTPVPGLFLGGGGSHPGGGLTCGPGALAAHVALTKLRR